MNEYVVKAQILAGGRGKGYFNNGFKGGVHVTEKYVNLFNSVSYNTQTLLSIWLLIKLKKDI